MLSQNIVIASNFTSEPLKDSLQFLLKELEIPSEISFAPFNQIFQELLSPASLFRANTRGTNVVLFRIEDFVGSRELTSVVLTQLEENVRELQSALSKASEFKVPMQVVICPPSKKIKVDRTAAEVIQRIQGSLVREVQDISNLSVFSAEDFIGNYGVGEYDDPKADNYGRIPYTMEFFAALGAFLARKIFAASAEPFKVIVLDCDQTLWKGVVGEDGVDGIVLDAPHLALQEFMAAQSDAGMLICLCSKNNESEVWDVFDSRSDMRLKREHIVASQINWNYKSENLKCLAPDLQLSLNSFIFVDDDPAVCAEVQANCPEVLTLMLPQETDDIPAFLQHVWAFDRIRSTKEDKERTRSYQQQIDRQRLQESSTSFGDFLAGLDLKCEIGEITEDQIPRVSQLSLRTNQFNSTTKRRSENDVRQHLVQKNCRIWTVSVRDRFGDYGLVGSIFGEKIEDRLCIDSLMLSCRALGRGIEHRMIAEIGRNAQGSNCEMVDLEFAASAKNTPIQNFLEQVGKEFKQVNADQTIYRFPANIAAATEFDPAQNISAPNVENGNVARPEPKGNRISERNAAIVRIAEEFKTATQILKATKASRNGRSIPKIDPIKPRTDAEQKLTDIWHRTLGISQIGVTDDFFQLGGDSLLAVSLFVEIEDVFGKHLPMTVLIESPTIEKMAESLAADSSERLRYLVPIKPEGNNSPLFCMHAAGGNVLFYRDLANELDAEQPVYGLQARGVADKSETAHENVAEMATEYLNEMRTVQPVGPYKLCGSSFGGLVAFEMACQLEANGEDVALLALFDTYAPGYPKKRPDAFPFESKLRGLFGKAGRFREQIGLIETRREKMEYFGKQIQKLRFRAKRKKAWTKNQFDIEYARSSGRELPIDVRRNHLAIQKALDTYKPTTFEGQMSLFRASLQPAGVIFEPTLGWKQYTVREIAIREVSGSHGALTVYPYAKHLARELSPFLKEQEAFSLAAKFAVA